MKVLGILLLVLGFAAIAASVVLGWSPAMDIRERRKAEPPMESRLQELRDGQYETNILYRGLQKSIPTLPDSVKMAQSMLIQDKYNTYNKKLTKYGIDIKEQTRLIARNRTKMGDSKSTIYRRSGPAVGAAVLFLVSGAITLRRASGGGA